MEIGSRLSSRLTALLNFLLVRADLSTFTKRIRFCSFCSTPCFHLPAHYRFHARFSIPLCVSQFVPVSSSSSAEFCCRVEVSVSFNEYMNVRTMKTAVLPNGKHMPLIGLGTWQAAPEVVEQAVAWALEIGYRLIDTAFNYGNEEAIGKAVQKWISEGGNREELFITTKLPNFGNRALDVTKYLRQSLSRLRLDYLDLYLIHHPFGFFEPPTGANPPILDVSTDHLSVWKEMEKAVRSGLVRNIGLSNFNAKQIEKIFAAADIKPANLQIELHAFLQQPDLVDFCKSLGISVTAYAPLGSPAAKTHFKNKYDFQPKQVPDCLTEPRVLEIAKRLQKTPAQVLLRFLMQMDVAVVPKSSSKERIKENFEAANFDLTHEDMKTLKSLDRGEDGRLFDFLFYKGVESHPEYPFPKRNVVT